MTGGATAGFRAGVTRADPQPQACQSSRTCRVRTTPHPVLQGGHLCLLPLAHWPSQSRPCPPFLLAHSHPIGQEQGVQGAGCSRDHSGSGQGDVQPCPATGAVWLSRPLPMGLDRLSVKWGCRGGCSLASSCSNLQHRRRGGSQTPVPSSQLGHLGAKAASVYCTDSGFLTKYLLLQKIHSRGKGDYRHLF